MRKWPINESEERRAYFRVLRYLLSEELKETYNVDQAEPLPPEMRLLLERLGKQPPKEIQKGTVRHRAEQLKLLRN